MTYYECYHRSKSYNFNTKLNYILNNMKHQALVTPIVVHVTMITPPKPLFWFGIPPNPTWIPLIRVPRLLGIQFRVFNNVGIEPIAPTFVTKSCNTLNSHDLRKFIALETNAGVILGLKTHVVCIFNNWATSSGFDWSPIEDSCPSWPPASKSFRA